MTLANCSIQRCLVLVIPRLDLGLERVRSEDAGDWESESTEFFDEIIASRFDEIFVSFTREPLFDLALRLWRGDEVPPLLRRPRGIRRRGEDFNRVTRIQLRV